MDGQTGLLGGSGMARGVVEALGMDKEKGTVRVRLPGMPPGQDIVEGVEVLQAPGGPKNGGYFLPAVGAQVLVGLLGDGCRPVVLGCLNDPAGGTAQKAYRKDGSFRQLLSPEGRGISIDDGEKAKSVSVHTANGLSLTLSEHTNGVKLCGGSGETLLELTEKGGVLHLKAAKQLVLEAGGAKITLEGGKLVLSAREIDLKGGKIVLNGSEAVNVKGFQIHLG